MTRLNPCRLCGEEKQIRLHPNAFLELRWGVDAEANVLRGPTGEPFGDCAPENGQDDGVSCDICESLVPLRVWNATPDWLARMRANILAADAEFDDDGVWRGQAVPA